MPRHTGRRGCRRDGRDGSVSPFGHGPTRRPRPGFASVHPDLKFRRGVFERTLPSAVSPATAVDPIVTKGLAAPGI